MLKAHISVWFLQELYLIHSFYLLRYFILFVFLKLMAHNIIISYAVVIALSLSGIVLPLSIRCIVLSKSSACSQCAHSTRWPVFHTGPGLSAFRPNRPLWQIEKAGLSQFINCCFYYTIYM